MISNTSITIYNRFYNSATRLDEWKHKYIKNVSFFTDSKVSLDSDGLKSANIFKIRIPGSAPECRSYVSSEEYTGATGTWTVQMDDYIMIGEGGDVVSPKDFAGAIRVNSFSDNRRGNLPHLRIGGQ